VPPGAERASSEGPSASVRGGRFLKFFPPSEAEPRQSRRVEKTRQPQRCGFWSKSAPSGWAVDLFLPNLGFGRLVRRLWPWSRSAYPCPPWCRMRLLRGAFGQRAGRAFFEVFSPVKQNLVTPAASRKRQRRVSRVGARVVSSFTPAKHTPQTWSLMGGYPSLQQYVGCAENFGCSWPENGSHNTQPKSAAGG
jgi:hypothetical protein